MKELLNEFFKRILVEAGDANPTQTDQRNKDLVKFGQTSLDGKTIYLYGPPSTPEGSRGVATATHYSQQGQSGTKKPFTQAEKQRAGQEAPTDAEKMGKGFIGKQGRGIIPPSPGQEPQPTQSQKPEEPNMTPDEKADDVVATSGDEDEANQKGVYDENDGLQRAVVDARDPQEVFDTVDKLADEERDLALNGEEVIVKGKKIIRPKAGAGGLIPSTGETLCTEAQSAMVNGKYDAGEIRSSSEFTRIYEELGNKHSTIDKQGNLVYKKPSVEIELIADMHGIDLYDENGTVTQAGMESCLQLMAEEAVWVAQQDAEFSKTLAGRAFGEGSKGREARHAWLKAAFHSAYSLQANGPTQWDRSKPARVVKANSRTDGAIQELLRRKRDEAKTSEERRHYEHQLEVWQHFQPYHDTYMVYTDTNGRTSVFHISNKKGSDLKDPHNNTSPTRRLLNFLLAATKIVPRTGTTSEERKAEAKRIAVGISKADAVARKGVENIDQTVWTTMSGLDATPEELTLMGGLFKKLPLGQKESAVGDKYFLELTNPKSESGRLLVKAGVDLADPQAVITHILKTMAETEDTSTLPQAWLDRVGLKYGTLAQRVFEKIDDQKMTPEQTAEKLGLTVEEVKAIYASKVMKKLASAKRAHAKGLAGVNEQFVGDLHELDGTTPGGTEDNGPSVETYIRGTMQALHFDTYITNFDEDVQVESGGMGTKPVDVRNCMAKLSGFTGDISTSAGREELKEHLGKKLKLEPGSDAVYILAADGKTKIYIAKETWRQSGKSKKVASGFGDDLRDCLMKATGNRLRGK